ncbi:hypothetical protein H6G06_22225 [Anabaena sphaerica FACHB-251]|uniref:Uncharacterized protein n=1 Tax=Anabaena sphaerica FACHB-251 TaxID=2692883 RepID=A0A927A2U6_9NOST|nr:hypothetical protein [Anabaena sphaerica]MBD2296119.1 hypothetical protein [Anabaena sphaerica FACHB-251]
MTIAEFYVKNITNLLIYVEKVGNSRAENFGTEPEKLWQNVNGYAEKQPC